MKENPRLSVEIMSILIIRQNCVMLVTNFVDKILKNKFALENYFL